MTRQYQMYAKAVKSQAYVVMDIAKTLARL